MRDARSPDKTDDPVEVVEGVHVGRDARLDALDADRVEPHERDGEAGPKLFLELGQDGLEGDDEDAGAAASADQLGEEDADLDGLAEADAAGREDARAELAEGLDGGVPLVGATLMAARWPTYRCGSVGGVRRRRASR